MEISKAFALVLIVGFSSNGRVSYITLALRALAEVAGVPTGCAHFIGNWLGKAQILPLRSQQKEWR